MQSEKKLSGHLLALFSILVWGTTFIFTKILLGTFSEVELFYLRYTVAVLALFIAKPRRMKTQQAKHELLFLGAGVCGVSMYYMLEVLALGYTYASNVSVIIATAPMFTAVFASLFLKERALKGRFVVGFIIAIVGIFLISFNGSFNLKLNPLGDLLALAAAAVWAIYSILIKKIGALGYDTILSTRRIFLYGMVTMVPFAFIFKLDWANFANVLQPANLFPVLFLGLIASALCYVTWNLALRTLGPVKTSVYIYLIPVITVIASYFALGEQLTVLSALGVVLTLLGLLVSENKAKKA